MKVTLKIQNLKCSGCANTILNKISSIENINELIVDNENDTVLFNYTTEEDLLLVKNTLVKLGYPIVGEKNALTTKAKSFVSCAIGRVNSN